MKATYLISSLADIMAHYGDVEVKIVHIDEPPCDKIDCVSYDDDRGCIILEIEY